MPDRSSVLLVVGIASIIGVVGLVGPAGAAGELTYRAPPGCANEGEFRKAVEGRGSSFDGTAADVTVDVVIEARREGFAGVLRARRSGGASSPREVTAVTCTEVVDALAVVAALALRPESETSQAVEAVSTPQTSSVVETPGSPSAVPEPPETARPRRPPVKAVGSYPSPFEFGDRNVTVPAGTLTFGSVTGVTGFGGVAVGVVPGEIVPRLELELFRANLVTTPTDQSYLLGPILRFHVGLLADVTHLSGTRATQVGAQSFAVGVCYAPVFDSGGLLLLGCAELAATFAQLTTKDSSGAVVESKTAGMGTTGLSLEAVYNIGRHFQLATKIGADVTASPLYAENGDGSRIWQGSYVSGHGMLGLGGHW